VFLIFIDLIFYVNATFNTNISIQLGIKNGLIFERAVVLLEYYYNYWCMFNYGCFKLAASALLRAMA